MAEPDSIRCMQLPLSDTTLLVPNSAVSEIIGYSAPEPAQVDVSWLHGHISWRGVTIPIISFEKLCYQELGAPGTRTRIAVLYNALAENSTLPYFGVILQDIPRGYFAQKDRLLSTLEHADCDYIAGRADAMNDRLVVPDLDAVVSTLRQALNL